MAVDAVERREDVELHEVEQAAVRAVAEELVEVAVHRREGGAEVEEERAAPVLEEDLVAADDPGAVPDGEADGHRALARAALFRGRARRGVRGSSSHGTSAGSSSRRMGSRART